MRRQPATGPIATGGLEDTALEVYYPRSSLNEVDASAKTAMAIVRFRTSLRLRYLERHQLHDPGAGVREWRGGLIGAQR
jgi:hypothetical protein